jgi:phycoerythrobilin:ferredoxin oxidoreductase
LTALQRCRDEALEALKEAGFESKTLPEAFRERSGNVGVELRSFWLAHPLGTQMKCAHLHGPRSEILNLMIYPNQAETVPIFAVEYIVFVTKPFVAVVDLQPAAGVDSPLTSAVVSALKTPWTELSAKLSSGGDLPDWAHSHFTPTAIYTRPQAAEEMITLEEAFSTYLGIWLRDFFPNEQATPVGQNDVAAYQHHHVENTPGRTYLSKTFGAEWTENYLRNFMYTSQES